MQILNWGKYGWSTLDQFNFLVNEGYKYQFDYLIFAYVINDPVMDSSSPKEFFLPGSFVEKYITGKLSVIFPNTISFFTDITNNFLAAHFSYGYYNGVVNTIYNEGNIKKYSELLGEIKNYFV